jgi:5-formyltetrahydrofolate cyclo-ligase
VGAIDQHLATIGHRAHETFVDEMVEGGKGGLGHALGYRGEVAQGDGQSTPAVDAGKGAWRAWAKRTRAAWCADADRRARDEGALQRALRAWGGWRRARLALIYLPFGDEPNPLPTGAGNPALATTRTVGAGAPLQLRLLAGPLERHPLGFWQPHAEAPPVDPGAVELVLVPGLAFDALGHRLGYGAGHYDRLLPTLPPGIPLIGVAIDPLRVARLPYEAHDVRMTHLLTPTGLLPVDTD